MTTIRQYLHCLIWAKRLRWPGKPYDANEIAFIADRLEPDDVVLDIGAHGGAWTKPLAEAVPLGHVYAFEALPYYARTLDLTLAVLGHRNVTVRSHAVVEHDGPVSLVWNDDDGHRIRGRTHVATGHEDKRRTLNVDGQSLDSFRSTIDVDRPIRFMKLDIEGAELAALRGATKLLELDRPIIFCELWHEYCQRYDHTPMDVFTFLAERHFRPMLITSSTETRPITPTTYDGRGDVLFVPDELNL